MSDLFFNQIGSVMVVAPNPAGRLKDLVQQKTVAFYENQDGEAALTRWIFADFPQGTLKDQWNNRYDHQVHSLLSGSISDGKRFVEMLGERGFIIEEATELFVPFQKLDIHSEESSDGLRSAHPRAFALARRGRKSVVALVNDIRDSVIVNQRS